jgi:hypothetical protein
MVAFLLLSACSNQGEWTLETWGEEYIEEEIPSADFADGCEATYDTFLVSMTEMGLVDGNGEYAATIPGSLVFDVSQVGPHFVGSSAAPVGLYTTVKARIAPSTDLEAGNATEAQVALLRDNGWSVYAEGSATCGAETVSFAWGYAGDTTYLCEPSGLEVPRGGAALSELTIHGDHLFYDGLEDPDAQVRGRAIVDADADGDGIVTHAELAAVDVAPLGYTVGRFGDVRNLDQFVGHLTTTLGHIDGEGHCTTVRQ